MKKVLFLFAFLLLGIGAMAQKVIYDETNQTGVRTGTIQIWTEKAYPDTVLWTGRQRRL